MKKGEIFVFEADERKTQGNVCLTPPTRFSHLLSALLKGTSKEKLYECKMKSARVSAPEERKAGLLYTMLPLWLLLIPLAQHCSTTSEVCLTFSRSLYSARPLCLSQGPAAKLKGPGFVFCFFLVRVESLPRGRNT